MNSQDLRNLQEAYLQVYSAPTLNEFGPGDAGGSLAVKRTFGGAPGTKQNTTVSGSASVGGSNVSGSLEKGTFSGQGDKTSQGIDNALKDYDDQVKNGKPNVTPRPTGTSTITTGVRGTLDANVSGKFGSGNTAQDARKRDANKAAVMTNVAKNLASQNQQKAKAAANAAASSTSTQLKSDDPDGEKANAERAKKIQADSDSEKETRNSTYLKNRADLVRAGVTDEAGNENPNGRRDLENRLGGKDGATAGDLLTKLRNVTDNNNASQLKNSTGVKRIVQKSPGVYGAESFDLFDYMMEYLIDEGYADTNENALVIMANMSEEWRESIIEQQTDPLKTAAENSAKRNDAYGSKKFQQVVDDSPSNPRSKNFNPNSLKTPGV